MKNVKELEYKECKYRVAEAAIVFPDGSEHKINGDLDIPYLFLKKDFDNEQYPFFEVCTTVSHMLYRKMRKSNDQLKFRLNMRYAMFEKGAISINEDNIEEKPFISKTFYLFLEDSTAYNQDSIYEEIERTTGYGDYNEDETDLNHATTVRFSLYDGDAITEPKKLHKEVLHAVTITDVMTYILMQRVRFTKILMSPSSNGKMYDQFVLPPEQVDYQLDRVSNEYNLLDNGNILFFDFDRLYITEKIPKCTAWEPHEVKRVYIVSIPTTENNVLSAGAYYDGENNEIYLTTKSQLIETVTMENEIKSGSGILVINKRTGKAESFVIDGDQIKAAPKFTGKAGEQSIKYDRTIVINTGEDTIKALKERLNERALSWTVYLDYTMVDALKPNREYNFVFTDPNQSKYNGTYRLTGINAKFDMATADNKWRGVNTTATFVGVYNDKQGAINQIGAAAGNAISNAFNAIQSQL